MSRAPEEPIHRESDDRPGSTESSQKETHPAFALIQANRFTGNPGIMFGSHLNHHGGITITIRRAQRIHDLSRDWYFGRGELIEVQLTANQFAEMITSMNMGSGVPCTLTYTEKDGQIPRISDEFESEQDKDKDKVSTGFKEKVKGLGEKLRKRFKDVEEVLKKKSLNKADRKVVADAMYHALMEIDFELPFVLDQFIEATEKVTQEAKTEVEGFMTSALQQVGLKSLKALEKGDEHAQLTEEKES